MAAHFPTLPPLSAPSPYVSTWAVPRAPGRRDAISLSPLGAQVFVVPHYEQPRSLRQSKHGIRVIRTPKCPPPLSGLFQSWGTWDTQMPYLPTAHSHWDKISACGARGSVGVPPSSCLRLPGGRAAELGDCWPPTLLLELLLPATLGLSFYPTRGLHGAPSQRPPPQAGSPPFQASPLI